MARLSAYMSEAKDRALPEMVIERIKEHVLDTFAAMISGCDLPPGRIPWTENTRLTLGIDNAFNHSPPLYDDGVGYDLDAFAQMLPEEKDRVVQEIHAKGNLDWRDMEVLR